MACCLPYSNTLYLDKHGITFTLTNTDNYPKAGVLVLDGLKKCKAVFRFGLESSPALQKYEHYNPQSKCDQ